MLRESGQAGAGLPRGRSGLASCSDTRHLLCWGEAGELSGGWCWAHGRVCSSIVNCATATF